MGGNGIEFAPDRSQSKGEAVSPDFYEDILDALIGQDIDKGRFDLVMERLGVKIPHDSDDRAIVFCVEKFRELPSGGIFNSDLFCEGLVNNNGMIHIGPAIFPEVSPFDDFNSQGIDKVPVNMVIGRNELLRLLVLPESGHPIGRHSIFGTTDRLDFFMGQKVVLKNGKGGVVPSGVIREVSKRNNKNLIIVISEILMDEKSMLFQQENSADDQKDRDAELEKDQDPAEGVFHGQLEFSPEEFDGGEPGQDQCRIAACGDSHQQDEEAQDTGRESYGGKIELDGLSREPVECGDKKTNQA